MGATLRLTCIPKGLVNEAGTELSSELSAEEYKDANADLQKANLGKKPAPKPKTKSPEELKKAEQAKYRNNASGFLEPGYQGILASAW